MVFRTIVIVIMHCCAVFANGKFLLVVCIISFVIMVVRSILAVCVTIMIVIVSVV
jgi:hypothetical protein